MRFGSPRLQSPSWKLAWASKRTQSGIRKSSLQYRVSAAPQPQAAPVCVPVEVVVPVAEPELLVLPEFVCVAFSVAVPVLLVVCINVPLSFEVSVNAALSVAGPVSLVVCVEVPLAPAALFRPRSTTMRKGVELGKSLDFRKCHQAKARRTRSVKK